MKSDRIVSLLLLSSALCLITKVLRVQKKVTLTLGFADDDKIKTLDVVMA